ncbi:MAG TPA: thrombospondin type 3 repeat-containing protein [Kofleriaceae bacterium]|nr:thrombospondin type 3 repeat-containing protein [Kofleriaceae bacterium]
MRCGAILAVLLLAGCNAVFGLEPTISIDGGAGDFDHDQVADDVDNCPTVKNTMQENADGDAFGDACDTCPMVASTSVHDEDGDRLGDDCDRCPGVPDFQDDTDMDGIGDLCDPSAASTPNRRVIFDPFVQLSSAWHSDTLPWDVQRESVGPASNLDAADVGLRNTQLTTASVWTATIGVEASARWSDGDEFGIVFSAGGHLTRCVVVCETGQCVMKFMVDGAVNGVTSSLARTPHAQISVYGNPSGVICVLVGGYSIAGPTMTDQATISLLGSPNLRVTYFDYIE